MQGHDHIYILNTADDGIPSACTVFKFRLVSMNMENGEEWSIADAGCSMMYVRPQADSQAVDSCR